MTIKVTIVNTGHLPVDVINMDEPEVGPATIAEKGTLSVGENISHYVYPGRTIKIEEPRI